jgi:hypothetical protein
MLILKSISDKMEGKLKTVPGLKVWRRNQFCGNLIVPKRGKADNLN